MPRATMTPQHVCVGAAAILIAGAAVGASLVSASAQPATVETATVITPPRGNVLFLKASAIGTQDYVCLPAASSQSTVWTFERPQAALAVKFAVASKSDVAEHSLTAAPGTAAAASPACVEAADGHSQYCPTWRNPFDQSAVWGTKVASIDAGSSAICPHAGAIPCLLLQTVATVPGSRPRGLFARTTYIQRLNTNGGAAPTTACTVGQIEQVLYTADYAFFSSQS
jgi:hypothetical protein